MKIPSPKAISELADNVDALIKPRLIDAEDYMEAIEKLRLKNLSFREIASWLNDRGVPLTYNQIYRAFIRKWGSDESFRYHKEQEALAEEAKLNSPEYQAYLEQREAELEGLSDEERKAMQETIRKDFSTMGYPLANPEKFDPDEKLYK